MPQDKGAEAARPQAAGAGWAGRLSLTVLGPFRAEIDGRAAPALSPKARALLGALAVTPGGEMTRGAAARLLWSGADMARARVALRQCLRGLRAALEPAGFAGLSAERERLILDPGAMRCDLGDALATAEAGVAHPALLGGEDALGALLADAVGLGSAFEAWREATQARWRAALRAPLEAALARASGPVERLALARALWAVDPAGEVAARALMTALDACGERAAALAVYDALWRRLDAAHDAEPSAETRALLEALERGGPSPDAEPPAPTPRPEAPQRCRLRAAPPRIAGAADGLAAAAGLLAEELLARLAAFDGLSVFRRPDAPAEIELGLLVAADGPDWRVLATLTRLADGEALVSARARLGPVDWAEALDAAALRLAAGVGAAAAATAPPDPARPLLHALPSAPVASRSPPTGTALMLRAVEDGLPATAAEAAAAAAAAAAAVESAPLSPIARRDAGWAALLSRRFDDAAAEFALAAELNPADVEGLRDAALGLALAGREAEARRLETLADALRPAVWSWRSALTALALGATAPPHPAEPLLATAWRAAALGRDGAAASAPLRDGAPPDALAARLAAALPLAEEARAAALAAGLRLAMLGDRAASDGAARALTPGRRPEDS